MNGRKISGGLAFLLGLSPVTVNANEPKESTNVQIQSTTPATEAEEKTFYVNGEDKTEITDTNQADVYNRIKDGIVEEISGLNRNTEMDRFLSQIKDNPDHFLVMPVENGFQLCYDANENQTCDADEERVNSPENGNTFTHHGKIVTETIPAKGSSSDLTVIETRTRDVTMKPGESLEDALTHGETTTLQNRNIFSLGFVGQDVSGEFVPGMMLGYDRVTDNLFVYGVSGSFSHTAGTSTETPGLVEQTDGNFLNTQFNRDQRRYFVEAGLDFGKLFESGWGLVGHLGYQHGWGSGTERRHEEIQDPKGNLVATNGDNKDSYDPENSNKMVFDLRTPIKLCDNFLGGSWFFTPSVGINTNFNDVGYQMGGMFGYSPMEKKE